MSRNASGTYSVPGTVNPVITGTDITTNWANTTLADVAQGITDSLDRQGRGSMLAALKLVDGALATPGLTFANDTGAGFARLASGEFSTVIGGVETIKYKSTLTTFPVVASFAQAQSTYVPAVAADLVNKLYADNLSFSTSLPGQAGNSGKFVRTNGVAASWEDYDGALSATLTSNTTLVARTSYRVDSSGGAFNLQLPALVADVWIKITDVTGGCGTNVITVIPNGTDKIMNLAENLEIDIAYADFKLRGTTARGWVLCA